MFKNKVSDLMTDRALARIPPDASLREACAIIDSEDVGAVLVCEGRAMRGILSERDVIRKGICQGRPTADTRVAGIMNQDPVTTTPDAPVAEAFSKMLADGLRHLPVIKRDGPIGVLSMRDIPTENRLMVERYLEYTEAAA